LVAALRPAYGGRYFFLCTYSEAENAVVTESNNGPQDLPHHAETHSTPGAQSSQAPGRAAQQASSSATSGRARRTSAAETAIGAATPPCPGANASVAAAGDTRDDTGVSQCAAPAFAPYQHRQAGATNGSGGPRRNGQPAVTEV